MTESEESENRLRRKLYSVWAGMKNRCDNPNNPAYSRYGGRGIRVCPEWYDFETFYIWALQSGYVYERGGVNDSTNRWSIDRINVNGNYCPANCRWTDRAGQMHNTRGARFILLEGKYVDLFTVSAQLNIPVEYLARYFKQGASLEEIVKMYRGEYTQKNIYVSKDEFEKIQKYIREELRKEEHRSEIVTASEVLDKIQIGEIKSQDVIREKPAKPKKIPQWMEELLENNWSSYTELTKEELAIADNIHFRQCLTDFYNAKDYNKEILRRKIIDTYGVEE